MRVAIVVPVYNAQNYIAECFYAIDAQTYKDVEAVFVDDCSTDNSKEILRKLLRERKAAGKSVYKLIEHETNKNVSAARNSGIEYVLGRHKNGGEKVDFIMFIDSDDIITPNCVEHLIKYAKKYPAAQIIQGAHISVPNEYWNKMFSQRMSDKHWNIIYETLILKTKRKNYEEVIDAASCGIIKFWLQNFRIYENIALLGVWAALYDCRLIEENNILFDKNLPNTQDVYFRYLSFKYARQVVLEHTPVYIYRGVEGSLSNKKDKYQRISCWLYCIEKIMADANDSNLYDELLLFWCFKWSQIWVDECKTEKEKTLVAQYLKVLNEINVRVARKNGENG
jgi:glycosyltransferase involved in cell wall biosynthesis